MAFYFKLATSFSYVNNFKTRIKTQLAKKHTAKGRKEHAAGATISPLDSAMGGFAPKHTAVLRLQPWSAIFLPAVPLVAGCCRE